MTRKGSVCVQYRHNHCRPNYIAYVSNNITFFQIFSLVVDWTHRCGTRGYGGLTVQTEGETKHKNVSEWQHNCPWHADTIHFWVLLQSLFPQLGQWANNALTGHLSASGGTTGDSAAGLKADRSFLNRRKEGRKEQTELRWWQETGPDTTPWLTWTTAGKMPLKFSDLEVNCELVTA